MSRAMTLAAERIADDRRFAERFRADPERALRRYGLDAHQVEAIKRGDPVSLTTHGIDVMAFNDGRRHGWRAHWRKLVAGASIVGAMCFSFGNTARADSSRFVHGIRRASARQARMGRAIPVRGVLLERSSIRAGLVRAGVYVRAQGREALRRELGIFCGLKGCFLDVENADPIVLAGD